MPVAANLVVRPQRTLLTLQVWARVCKARAPAPGLPGAPAGHRGGGGIREAVRPPLLPAVDGGPGWRPEQADGGGVTDSSCFGRLAL